MTKREDPGYLYPDHTIDNTDIAGREYDLAAATVRAKSATLSALAALYAITSSVASLVGLANPADLSNVFQQLSEAGAYVRPLLIAVLIATAYGVSASLANARLDYVISARKIVIIRQLANVRFGRHNLILPAWRFEAAAHPYEIRMFEGWKFRYLFPLLFTLAAFGSILSAVIATYGIDPFASMGFGVALVLALTVYYRARLFETAENFLLLATYAFANFLDLKLDARRAYVLYRAKLAVLEAKRLGVNYRLLKKVVVFREDRTFEKNIGISLRGILRAAYQSIYNRKLQGGSSISQQLFRSLYVVDYHKSVRRKLVEILGAFWIKSAFSNDEILDLYICCVRYGPRSSGLMEAMKTLEISSKDLRITDAFVLAERISNIGANVRWEGISRSTADAVGSGLMVEGDEVQIKEKYRELIRHGILTDPEQPD